MNYHRTADPILLGFSQGSVIYNNFGLFGNIMQGWILDGFSQGCVIYNDFGLIGRFIQGWILD
jgi:predicted esterase